MYVAVLFESNYRVVDNIDAGLIDPIAEACKKANWDNSSYDRFERALVSGRLVEYPFPVRKANNIYTPEQIDILKASGPLLDWILTLPRFAGYKWIRGEIATLPPGVTLGWHKDPHWYQDQCVRLHIPIYTNDQCLQLWRDQVYHMEIGWLYEVNNRVMHSATNKGTNYRTHIILDLMPQQLWKESLEQGIDPSGLIDLPNAKVAGENGN